MIVVTRTVEVNRDQTPQQMLDATKRAQYTDKSVVASMPTGGAGTEEVTVEFIKLSRYATDEEVDQALAEHSLVSDPAAQVQVNADDPTFADEHPNGAHWKDVDGKWCVVIFGQDSGRRHVYVDGGGVDCDGSLLFGGVRK